jgi:hypothetical protein
MEEHIHAFPVLLTHGNIHRKVGPKKTTVAAIRVFELYRVGEDLREPVEIRLVFLGAI